MTRNVATTVENNFVLGLITERTELRFPQNAATDIDNCVIDLYGRVSRRKGMDFEENYQVKVITDDTAQSYTEYTWEGVAGDASRSFYCQQIGSKIYFSDTSSNTEIGSSFDATFIDLMDYIPIGSPENPASNPCSYAVGNGKLFVVNGAIDPIFIEYESGDFLVTVVEVNIRDFKGLEDGLRIDERPESNLSDLADDNPQHSYNIVNQGWYNDDALTSWDTDRSDLPSNSDVVGLYKAASTQAFDSGLVDFVFPGNTAAPKGHFILDAFNPLRDAAYNIETGFEIITDVENTYLSESGTESNFNDEDVAFDGDVFQSEDDSANFNGTEGYLGMAHSNTHVAAGVCTFAYDFTTNKDILVEMYAKATSSSDPTDGTLLGSTLVPRNTSTIPPIVIISSNPSTNYAHMWFRFTSPQGGSFRASVSDASFYSTYNNVTVNRRPSTVAFFNGRSFYAGVADGTQAGMIYFSRIIETDTHYHQFYSDNDPTAENFSDPLPSDGGYISIPDAGLITRLFATQSSLLVLATNGIWLIGGSGQGPFDASSYSVSKLSGVGSQCPQSCIDYKGTPAWWGDDGIYSVQFDANYNSYVVVSLTQDSIKSFFNAIPATARQKAKGLYDIEQDILYWLYSDGEAPDATTYNKVLVYVPRAKAYYPWTFPEGTFNIRGFYYVKDAVRADIPKIKYVVVDQATRTQLYYATAESDTYKDWSSYAVSSGVPSNELDYTSYVLAGYYIHGETQRFFQGNYLFVFVDQDTQGSCLVSTHYDWTTSGNSGKWGTQQQVYPDWQILQTVNYRRLKTRGKGRAMQLYFESEEGKPFSIIGWSVFESGNAAI